MTTDRDPIYAVIDRRQDGRPRIVAEYRDVDEALKAAALLQWSGDRNVEVVLITAIREVRE